MKILNVDGKSVLLDDSVFDTIKDMSFDIEPTGKYVRIYSEKHKQMVGLHRLVLCKDEELNDWSKPIDHIDRNKYNCQKNNLRFCTYGDNNRNKDKFWYGWKEPSSAYKGVSWNKRRNYFMCRITYNYSTVLIHKGTEIDCALAYNIAAKILFKEFAIVNPIRDYCNQSVHSSVLDIISRKIK